VRNLDGVIDTTMSVRHSPFGEWVIVYFDPKSVTEEIIHKTIKDGGCPRAKITRKLAKTTALTPIVTPGDTALLQLTLEKADSLTISEIPEGWAITEPVGKLSAGVHYLSLRTPAGAAKKKYKVTLAGANKKNHRFEVELVSRVGR